MTDMLLQAHHPRVGEREEIAKCLLGLKRLKLYKTVCILPCSTLTATWVLDPPSVRRREVSGFPTGNREHE